jgi:hypothetical protein
MSKCTLSRIDFSFKAIVDLCRMLYRWKLFDTDETRSDVKALSVQWDNCGLYDAGTICARHV